MKRNDLFRKAAEYIMNHEWKHDLPRHCAIIERKGRVIAHGFNDRKTHTMMLRYRKNQHALYLHAEISAIVKALHVFRGDVEKFRDCNLVVVRLTRSGRFANSKPCRGCMRAVRDYGFRSVMYS